MSMTTNCVVVWTTISAETDWLALASALIEERLAACVNVLPEMESIYRWQDAVERDCERQMVIKTTADRIPELRTRLVALHSYELPEFLVLPVIDGSDDYLAWVSQSTKQV
jgi:periplasmic divalent cation tolerance protein